MVQHLFTTKPKLQAVQGIPMGKLNNLDLRVTALENGGTGGGITGSGLANQVTFWSSTTAVTGAQTFRFLQSTGNVMLALGDASNTVTIGSNNSLTLTSAATKTLALTSGGSINITSASSYSVNIASGYQLALSSYGAQASITNNLTGGGLTINAAGASTLMSASGQVTLVYSTNTDVIVKSIGGAAKLFATTWSNGIYAWTNGSVDVTSANGDLNVFNATYVNGLLAGHAGNIALTSKNNAQLRIEGSGDTYVVGAFNGTGSLILTNNVYGNGSTYDANGGAQNYSYNSRDYYIYGDGYIVLNTPNYVQISSLAGTGTRPLAVDTYGNIIIGSAVSGGIVIPQLDVSIKQGTGETQAKYMDGPISGAPVSTSSIVVIAKYKGADQTFMSYNPRIRLNYFHLQQKNRNRPTKRKGYFHPSHLNGTVYQNKWTGRLTDLPDRITEWDLTVSPMITTELVIDPKEWRGPATMFMTDVFPYRVSDWEMDPNCQVKSSGKKYRDPVTGNTIYPAKTTSFTFQIIIDNPDPTTSTDIPFLYGPESRPIHISPKLGTFTDGSAFYSWKGRLGRTNGQR